MSKPKTINPLPQSAGSTEWGGAKQLRAPSGIKMKFEDDSDAILRFINTIDVGVKMTPPRADGEVIYLIFFDGVNTISLPTSRAFTGVIFEKDKWYYIHNERMFKTREDFNAFKDFNIVEIGKDGDEVPCPTRVSDSGILELRSDLIAAINYERLNYPLRGTSADPNVKKRA